MKTTVKQFAVMGNPIAHSRSPELHHAFAKDMGIALDYQKILVPIDDFETAVSDFFAQGGSGLNITVPFKERAYERADVVTERAIIAKAVNTLWQQDGQLWGDNTDGDGLVAALQFQGWSLQDARILILGAGGATRGVIYSLAYAGVTQITIANRTLSRAERLVTDLQAHVPNCALSASDLHNVSGDFDIVINATSASLSGESLKLPQQLTFDAAFEMAYGKVSDFLQQAQARGAAIADGYGMLVGQAIEAFAIWHDVRPQISDYLKQAY